MLQKISNKNYAKFLNLNNNEEKIEKTHARLNQANSKDFAFYKYHSTNELAKCCFHLNQNELTDFKGMLDTTHYDT